MINEGFFIGSWANETAKFDALLRKLSSDPRAKVAICVLYIIAPKVSHCQYLIKSLNATKFANM